MSSIFHRGQLKIWNDERGFGFIQPDDASKDVFIHISALKDMSRRPIVGDRIRYEIAEDTSGKIHAAHAAIDGVALHNRRSTHRSRSGTSTYDIALGGALLILLVIVISMAFLVLQSRSPGTAPPVLTTLRKPGCVIKGNISLTTGNKNYHLPGMEDYDATIIDPGKGEQWFCTEEEAVAQGWKRAPK